MAARVEDVMWSRWEEVDALFELAVAVAPEERPAFVGTECSGDDQLRAAVLALLRASDRAADQLRRPGRPLLRAALGERDPGVGEAPPPDP